jgi:DNA repair photolyase
MEPTQPRGRGSWINPLGRFRRIELSSLPEELAGDSDGDTESRDVATEYFEDDAKSIVSENDSPDIPFRYSLNPYRGCQHGCSYCYARPTHEYLDLGAGLDFESKIFVKRAAPQLFRDFLCRDEWRPEAITLSGVTDCYQGIERQLSLTRGCLEVAREARQPIALITKNALVERDIDLLSEMAAVNVISVAVSLTTLDQKLTRVMEPRTAAPQARLRVIRRLAEAGIPVHVMLAPIIPGLTDSEIPAMLEAAREAGASSASYILLRLPMTVEPVFREWLERALPEQRDRVESRIRSTRGGELYESGYGVRMRGRGELADQIAATFRVFAKKHGLNRPSPPLDATRFRRPVPRTGQRWLFDV